MAVATGPAIRAVFRIINQTSCGTASLCGRWNYQGQDGSLALSNAHVVGSQVGRKVKAWSEKLKREFTAEVIRAAYSNQVIADWGLLWIPGLTEIEPVLLSMDPPAEGESLYTKGFPKCQAHNGTDITQHAVLNNGVMLWLPDAIGGQSGSGVWGDDDNLQKSLLTWSWSQGNRTYGAGQLTSEIYKQNRAGEIRGFAKMPGLIELPGDFDFSGIDRTGATDPVAEEGFNSIPLPRNIVDFPIWYKATDPPPPPDPDDGELHKRAIESLRRVRDTADDEIKKWETGVSKPIDPPKPGDTFGL